MTQSKTPQKLSELTRIAVFAAAAKPHQNRQAGPYKLTLDTTLDHTEEPLFEDLARAFEQIGCGSAFYDTLAEAREALRAFTATIAPALQKYDAGISALVAIHWVITKDLKPIARGHLLGLWLDMLTEAENA